MTSSKKKAPAKKATAKKAPVKKTAKVDPTDDRQTAILQARAWKASLASLFSKKK